MVDIPVLKGRRLKKLFASLVYISFSISAHLFAQGIPYRTPNIEGFHPLDEEIRVENPISAENPAALKLETSLFSDTAIIDFESRQITFIRFDKKTQIPVWTYHYDELEEYLSSRQRFVLARTWYEIQKPEGKKGKKDSKLPSLDFQLPVHYPEWARRVLGKEPPRLTIKGYQMIELALTSSKVEIADQKAPGTQDARPHLEFNHDNQFNIKGSIGRLINVEIKAGKEQDFDIGDQLKDFKIVYKEDSSGELEDEIVQEVVAGYTNFEMPGAGLSGYSEGAEGLFGIKVRSKLGPLTLTTIVSHEKGEVKKDTLPLGTGGSGNQTTITEKDFEWYRFFFLDSAYLLKYLGKTGQAPEVTELKVYRWINARDQKLGVTQEYVTAYYGDTIPDPGDFVLLREYDQYYLNKKDGWIRFADSVSIRDEDIIVIYMRTSDNSISKGDLTLIDTIVTNLSVLKDKMPKPNHPTYHLMWPNVYKVHGRPEPKDFEIKIVRKDTEDGAERSDNGRYFTEILGIADATGKALTNSNDQNADGKRAVYDFENGYIILPPFTSDTIPANWSFANTGLGSNDGRPNTNAEMYTTSKTSRADWDKIQTNFTITLTGASERKTVFNLGWGVTPGTERVIKDGSTILERYRDYSINYESGELKLLSGEAQTASNIIVEYQRESIFVFDRKAFMGVHGKLDMPFIGRDSYFATSLLFQTISKGDKMPRIGQEPFNKLLLGMNTKIDFEPEWMTQAVNLLPLVSTNTPSSVIFDAEVAHSRMMPNSGTDAYIDNFESSSQIYDLGVSSHTRWFRASPPSDFLVEAAGGYDSLLWRPPAWEWYWYSPEGDDRTKRSDNWDIPAEDLKRNEDNYVRTLRFVTRPAPDNELADNYINPWAGIMTTIPVSIADRTDDRYLELWVKNLNGGELYIDMGTLSEDISWDGGPPNGSWNREFTNLTIYTYDSSFDRGLDTLWDVNERYLYPNFSNPFSPFWDTLGWGDTLLGKFVNDPNRDNWGGNYRWDSLGNKEGVNGTQGDLNIFLSEDLNDDGFKRQENFFRFKIDYNNIGSCPFIETNTNAKDKDKWRLFRIPVNDSTYLEKISGSPRWDEITFVRIWWTSMPNKTVENQMEFAAIQFVGNQWKPVPTDDTTKISVTVLSNKENKGYYETPNAVQMQLDYEQRETEATLEEHAIRLNYGNLLPGEEAYVERHFTYQEIDLSPYDELIFYVRDQMRRDQSTWFFFRFGMNDSTYYEYKTRNLDNTWDNGISVDLRNFSALKLEYLNNGNGERDMFDTSLILPGGSVYSIKSTTKTAPSFANIKWMALGVSRDDNSFDTDTGEIWIDDIGISGIKPLAGWAFRSNLSTRWADFMDLDANIRYDDADFRQMSESMLTPRDSKLSGAFNAQWTLNKFIPQKLGISLPLGASISNSLSRPKLRPESDIYLTDEEGDADNMKDMAGDFIDKIFQTNISKDTTESERYEKSTVTKSWYTSYNKNSYSENPIVNLTADRISTDCRIVKEASITGRGEHPDPDTALHMDHDTTQTYNGSIKYDLSPKEPPEWTRWSPFSEVKAKRFPRQMKEYELSYLPKTLNFSLISVNYVRSVHDETKKPESNFQRKRLGLDHGFQLKYEPIKPIIETSFDVKIHRDLDKDIDTWGATRDKKEKYWSGFLQHKVFQLDPVWKHYMITYGEKSRSQQASLNLTPEFVDWLTHSAEYSATYSHNPQEIMNDSTSYLKSQINSNVNFRSSFRVKNLISFFTEVTEKNKRLNSIFETMEKGLGKISLRDFNFTYNASSSLRNEYLTTMLLREKHISNFDFFIYQLGVKDRSFKDIITGDMNDRSDFGGMRSRNGIQEQDSLSLFKNDERTCKQDWKVSTDFRMPPPLDITFNTISLGWSRTYTVKPLTYPDYVDTTITFPEIRIGANSTMLQKIPIVTKQMRSLRLSSTFGYSRKKQRRAPIEPKNESVFKEYDFNPLVGLNGTVKKVPVDVSYRHNFTFRPDENSTSYEKKKEETNNHSNTWSVNYKTRASKLKEIKIFRWTIPIKGELSMGLNATQSHNKKTSSGKDYEETLIDETSIEVSPDLSYYFTENVQGKAGYSFKQSNNKKLQEKRTNNTLSISVKIDF